MVKCDTFLCWCAICHLHHSQRTVPPSSLFSQYPAQWLAHGGVPNKCLVGEQSLFDRFCVLPLPPCFLLPHKTNQTQGCCQVAYKFSSQASQNSGDCVGQAEQENISGHAGSGGSQLFRTTTFLAGETESTVDGEEGAAESGDGRQEGEDEG